MVRNVRRAVAGPAWSGRFLGLAMLAQACAPAGECEGSEFCLASDQVLRVWAGFSPDALLVADLDGDGTRDFIGASSIGGSLTVVWGGDTGSGAPDFATWSIGQETAGLAVADLDGDGRLDIAAALPADDAVVVLRGRGARRFAAPERRAVGASPRALRAIELSAAGPPALVVANTGDGTITALHGLVAAPPVAVGPEPRGLAAGDLDGDGDIDLAVVLAGAAAVQVLLGDGEGGLRTGQRHDVGLAPHAIVSADFDGDGRLDIATADALDDTVTVLWGDGRGGVRERGTWPTAQFPRGLALFGGLGGLPVLAVLSESTWSVELIDPRDGPRASGAPPVAPTALAADGASALYYAGSGSIGALHYGEGLALTERGDLQDQSRVWSVDLEGDGVDELIALRANEPYDLLTLWRDEPGGAGQLIETGLTWNLRDVVVGDLDGDGLGDVVAHDSGDLAVSIQTSKGYWTRPATRTSIGSSVDDLVLADLEGDGRDELVILAGDRLRVFAGDAQGELELREEVPLASKRASIHAVDRGAEPAGIVLGGESSLLLVDRLDAPMREVEVGGRVRGVRIAELDADAGLDAVVCAGDRLVLIPDVFGPAPAPMLLGETDCWDLEVVDIDGDGALDVLEVQWGRDVRRLVPWLRNGTTWSSRGARAVAIDSDRGLAILRRPVGGWLAGIDLLRLHWFDVGLADGLNDAPVAALDAEPSFVFGDVDGDGATDLIALDEQLSVALADGRGGLGPFQPRTFDFDGASGSQANFRVVPFADLDDDGVDEWIVVRMFDEHSEVRLGRLHGEVVVSHSLATLPDDNIGLRPADFDGDGSLDLLAWYGEEVVLWPGLGDGSFAAPRASTVAGGVSVEAIYDMDGDGVLDLLAANAKGVWMNSGHGDGSFAAAGMWTAVIGVGLVVGDFDGDGRGDVVVRNDDEMIFVPGTGHGQGGTPRRLGDEITAIGAGDLDRDGRPELIAASDRADVLSIGQWTGPELRLVPHPLAAHDVLAIRTVDLGDDHLGVAVIDYFGAAIVRVVR